MSESREELLLSRTLRLFLDSIGRREEYEFYLRKFQSDHSACFALVVPDDASVQTSGDLMIFDLQFLLRLELSPLLVLAGPNADTNLALLQDHGELERLPLSSDGTAEEWRQALQQAQKASRIPVWCDTAESPVEAVDRMIPHLTRRVQVLRAEGMLRNPETDERVFYHYLKRASALPLRSEDRPAVSMAERLLEKVPQLHVSISSPLYLLQEMFTVRGMGSIIRPGSEILHVQGLEGEGVDTSRLLNLIETAFGKPLRDPAILDQACDIYLESRYRGAVVLEPHSAGKYLSKFTVGTEARGEGVAQELWEEACAPQESLFWRSKSGNPVNHWYERQADGSHREGGWTVFWRGIKPQELPELIEYCLARPPDFRESS